MADSDHEQDTVKPTEQSGGTAPDAAEAREKGEWAALAGEGIVPAELGRSTRRPSCRTRIRSLAARSPE